MSESQNHRAVPKNEWELAWLVSMYGGREDGAYDKMADQWIADFIERRKDMDKREGEETPQTEMEFNYIAEQGLWATETGMQMARDACRLMEMRVCDLRTRLDEARKRIRELQHEREANRPH